MPLARGFNLEPILWSMENVTEAYRLIRLDREYSGQASMWVGIRQCAVLLGW